MSRAPLTDKGRVSISAAEHLLTCRPLKLELHVGLNPWDCPLAASTCCSCSSSSPFDTTWELKTRFNHRRPSATTEAG